jgi:dolichol-phosphate mannosyltransferase
VTFHFTSFINSVPGVPNYTSIKFREPTNDFALVIPVLNEGSRITQQLERIRESRIEFDVVVSDGGSTDGAITVEIMQSLGVSALLSKRGNGHLSAQLRMAIHYCLAAGYRGLVTMDGNNKDGIEGIERIGFLLHQGYDFVQGSRFIEGGQSINTPILRYAAIRAIHAPITSFASKHWYTDTTNGFRGHSRKLLEDLRVAPLRDVFDSYELLAYLPIRAARLGFRVGEVPVTRAYPKGVTIPTKIHGLRAHSSLFKVLIRAAIGSYNPPRTHI